MDFWNSDSSGANWASLLTAVAPALIGAVGGSLAHKSEQNYTEEQLQQNRQWKLQDDKAQREFEMAKLKETLAAAKKKPWEYQLEALQSALGAALQGGQLINNADTLGVNSIQRAYAMAGRGG